MSPYAAELLQWLQDPPEDGPPPRPVEGHRLSDEDIGDLLPAALLAKGSRAYVVQSGIEHLARERQLRFTADSCVRMLTVIADLAEEGYADVNLAVGTLLHAAQPWPPETVELVKRIMRRQLKRWRITSVEALLALAAIVGQPQFRVPQAGSPLVAAEREVLAAIGVPALLLVADLVPQEFRRIAEVPDALSRLAAFEDYQAFARQALSEAVQRAEQIQAGVIAYAADKAFTHDEVATLGRAARTVLALDDSGADDILGRLARAVCVPPTEAKTPPSQALLYEIARSVADFPTPQALAALRTARALARHKGVLKHLDRITKRIERALSGRIDVALRLPDLGFRSDGTRIVEIGEHKVTITADGDVTLPVALRRAYPEEVKELRGLARQAKEHTRTLARVLDAGLFEAVTVTRAQLAATSLGWHVARRLIWEIEVEPGRWAAALADDIEAEGPMRLWHPLRATVDEVRAWRERLDAQGARQPFKQAYREVYPITPAERETELYSLRFAGHVVRNKQLYALMKTRGWQSPLLGPWDGGDTAEARRVFGGWRITLALELVWWDQEVELAGTGRVSFERLVDGSWRPVPLAEVPPLVFSEAMRDVDLFVAAASVANDPEWTYDRFGEYWRDTGFGELSTTAALRREALERLLPRLRIAARCTLTDRFLVVRGDRFTYQIHLGSSNILVQPGGSYLCIVPARKPSEQLYLPFDDDRLGLILSKAFLLADDAKITDPSILAQLP
jgi:Domain of unknown function (DUF4132)